MTGVQTCALPICFPVTINGSARRNVLFVNECNNITFESYHQLAIRTRRFIYLDYNPTSEFWVHKELLSDKDAEMIILTYKDNEALDSELVKEIEKARERAKESTYWANWDTSRGRSTSPKRLSRSLADFSKSFDSLCVSQSRYNRLLIDFLTHRSSGS